MSLTVGTPYSSGVSLRATMMLTTNGSNLDITWVTKASEEVHGASVECTRLRSGEKCRFCPRADFVAEKEEAKARSASRRCAMGLSMRYLRNRYAYPRTNPGSWTTISCRTRTVTQSSD